MMTVLEREMMEAIIRMAHSLDDLNKQVRTHNELLKKIAESMENEDESDNKL